MVSRDKETGTRPVLARSFMLNNLMGSTAQQSAVDTEETETDLSGSSIWASESHVEHSCGSGEEDDIESCTNEGTISPASSGFEIGSPIIVDLPYSSEEEAERYNHERLLRQSSETQKSLKRQTRSKVLHDGKYSEGHSESDDLSTTTSSKDGESVQHTHVSSQEQPKSEPLGIFTEAPSPERPFLRPPSATARELMEIHKNYRRGCHQEWPVLLPPNLDEDLQNLDHSDPTKRPRYLPLAPPYHLLPNTSFFRKAAIKPPPTYCSDGLPPLKRIINRYLASILIDHMKNEEELRVFMQERKRLVQKEVQKREGNTKEFDDTEAGEEKTLREEQSLSLHHRQKRMPRVVIHHLLYGGQLIHYIQDGNEPPSIPGYFTNAPLIPSNVRITRELNGTAPLEYQQLRTTQGFQFVPFGQVADEGKDILGVMPDPCTPPLAMPSPAQSMGGSDVDDVVDDAGETNPEFSVVATERYASISITSNVLNLKFAERCVSICRSPQQV
ncbi:hypothetical protein GCK32_015522 [Trichostrongylus colubriformis]|uniref:Uncharacterized protein n=1 Tax=Trichostrongylus colubriformis TaxID=6319 RepID=A0AAN8IEQ7_TRICO